MQHSTNNSYENEHHRSLLTSGYLLKHDSRNYIAKYMPVLNQVWTNPILPKRTINRALIEEFIHNSTCRSKPAQYHAVINWLRRNYDCPTPNEYKDIVEALAIAAYPLGKSRPIAYRSLPRAVPKDDLELAKRIVNLAKRHAQHSAPSLLPSAANREALWAVIIFLSNVVPLLPQQANNIMDLLDQFVFPGTWSSAHELMEYLIAKTSSVINEKGSSHLGFTICRPRDPHHIISSMLQIFDCVHANLRLDLNVSLETLLPIFPILLHEITLGNAGLLPIYWLRSRNKCISVTIDIWHETPELITITERTMSSALSANLSNSSRCHAKQIYYEVHNFVKQYVQQNGIYNTSGIFMDMLQRIPNMIGRLKSTNPSKINCRLCRTTFSNGKDQALIDKFLISIPKIISEYQIIGLRYKDWLLSKGLKLVEDDNRKYSNLPFDLRVIDRQVLRRRRNIMPWLEIVNPMDTLSLGYKQ